MSKQLTIDNSQLTKKISNERSSFALQNEFGQSLIEMVVAMAVSIMVVGGLVFVTISSLRNANFAKSQAQATKLAQEGLERVRAIKIQNGVTTGTFGTQTTSKFSDLYNVQMSNYSCPCNFKLFSDNTSLNSDVNPELLTGGFKRYLQITDDASWATEKRIIVIVSWEDPTGIHESKLVTILTNR